MSDSGDDFSPLTHQVAGCHSGTPSNILINKSGQILKPYKPVSNPTFDPDLDHAAITDPKDLYPVTLNELQFYALLEKSTSPDFVRMKNISPKYFGAKMIKGTDHVLLEDFTHGMKYPCVMDLKIGKDRYYPGRSAEKAKQDSIKYPCLQEFGFCIAGIKISDPSSGHVQLHHMPKVTRKFSSQEVAEHIRLFMHWDQPCAGPLRQALLEGGQRVLEWAQGQTSVLLRGSSLLFVYDAAGLDAADDGGGGGGGGDGQDDASLSLNARVGMIDFAHAFHSFGKQDVNYVHGMENLVQVLREGQLPPR